MSEDSNKKKRYEGLIQFREALRQSIVCLQASMGDRFAHSLKSGLVRSLDSGCSDAFHLLFALNGQDMGTVDNLGQMQPHHLLARIYQLQDDDLKDELTWHADKFSQISAWLDPGDAQAAAFLYRLISISCANQGFLDLKQTLPWGGIIQSSPLKTPADALNFAAECEHKYSFCNERLLAFQNFIAQLSPIVQTLQSAHLLSDGSSVGLLIEGEPKVALSSSIQETLKQLSSCHAHTVTINDRYPKGSTVQFAIFTPIRLNHSNLGTPSLKGVIYLRDTKLAKKAKKPKLAS